MATDINTRFAANTYSYTLLGDVDACLARVADLGFRELELMMYPGHMWAPAMDAAARAALAKRIAAAGLSVRTLNQPNIDINLAAPSEEMRAYSLALVRDLFSLAGDLGAEGVVVGPGKPNPLLPAPTERMMGWYFAALDVLHPHAQACGTRILMENMPFCFLPDADSLMASLETYGADDIGIVYDVANAHFIGEDLMEGFRRVAPRLHTVHLSDTNRQVYRHDPVGMGDVDFACALDAARAAGHARPAVLEVISADPDTALPDSAHRLAALGWDRIAA